MIMNNINVDIFYDHYIKLPGKYYVVNESLT